MTTAAGTQSTCCKSLPGYALRPEWYQVMYNLAAQRTHAGLLPESALPRLGADLLYAARGRRSSLAEVDVEAEGAAEPGDAVEPLTIEETESELRRLSIADAEESLDKGTRAVAALTQQDLKWAYSLRQGGKARRAHEERAATVEFLRHTVLPATMILVAGLYAEDLPPAERIAVADRAADATDPPKVDLVDVWSKAPADRADRISFFIRWARLAAPRSHRTDYNLACFFASSLDLGQSKDRHSAQNRRLAAEAFARLRTSLYTVPLDEAASLISWAGKDPSLHPLGRFDEEKFHGLLAIFSTKPPAGARRG